MTSLIRRPAPLANFVDRFFDEAYFSGFPFAESKEQPNGFFPAVDISQTEDQFVFQVDLPGVKKEEVQLSIENNALTLSGERAFEKFDDSQSFSRVERSYGRFARTFQLPTNVDTTKVDATFEDGVLRVSVPKSEQARTRKIEIA